MEARNQIIDSESTNDDLQEVGLRPKLLSDFVGQKGLKQNLKIFLDAAKSRNEALDHVIFYGPPGLGKTTLSQVIANEMEVNIKITSGPILSKSGDLAALLTNLSDKDVLFIDEIHRLPTAVEEVLYSAMEDYRLDIIIGEGPSARTVKINLPKFTLIGATTRLGMLSNPLKDRFGIPFKLDFYQADELAEIVKRGALILGVEIDEIASNMLAEAARGTPRIALRILRRVRDFAQYKEQKNIDSYIVELALSALRINSIGLDQMDNNYLQYIYENYAGGPVGIETIAAGLSEDKDTIEDIIEPYLIQIGFVSRTPRGRVLNSKSINYLTELLEI